MLAVLCYVLWVRHCLSIYLCVQVYLCLLYAGLTYLWLYACSTRITLQFSIVKIVNTLVQSRFPLTKLILQMPLMSPIGWQFLSSGKVSFQNVPFRWETYFNRIDGSIYLYSFQVGTIVLWPFQAVVFSSFHRNLIQTIFQDINFGN